MFLSFSISHVRFFLITFYLSRFDEKMLDACNLITTFDVVTRSFFLTAQGAVATTVSREGDATQTTQVVVKSICLNTLAYLPLYTTLLFATKPLAQLLYEDTEITERVSAFFWTYAYTLAVIPSMLNVVLTIIWTNSNKMNEKFLLLAKCAREAITLGLYHWFITYAETPAELVQQAGYATSLGTWIGLAINAGCFYLYKMLANPLRSNLSELELSRKLLYDGIKMGAQRLLEPISCILMVALLVRSGDQSALAANEASGQWITLMLYVTLAVSRITFIHSSDSKKSGNAHNLVVYAITAILLNALVNGLIYAALVLADSQVINVFLQGQQKEASSDILALAKKFIWQRGFAQMADAAGHNLAASLKGQGYLGIPLLSRAISLFVLFPLLAIVAYDLAVENIVFSHSVSLVVEMGLIATGWLYVIRKRPPQRDNEGLGDAMPLVAVEPSNKNRRIDGPRHHQLWSHGENAAANAQPSYQQSAQSGTLSIQ